ncbi:MAG: SDR family NAD(P)-dependent oxidoreductase, partial [Pseudolabrys sp.]
LSQPEEISAAKDFVLSSWDHLNILVNCAGIAHYGATEAMTNEQWNRVLSVNLWAPVRLVRMLLPTLVAQEEAHIVNVCSIFGLSAAPRFAAYQTSKFALVGFSMAMRAEYGRPGFGVTALCPGFVQTPMIKNLANDLRGQGIAVPS